MRNVYIIDTEIVLGYPSQIAFTSFDKALKYAQNELGKDCGVRYVGHSDLCGYDKIMYENESGSPYHMIIRKIKVN